MAQERRAERRRAQDARGGYASARELRRLAEAARPDWILCVASEEAPALAGVAPLLVDLYAPRPLEAAFQGEQRAEAQATLRAIAAADDLLFSNERHRWFFLGLLGACGWALARPIGHVVPLAAPIGAPARRAPGAPRFVIGGHPWPWQDARDTVRRAVAWLGDRGEVVTVGLPPEDGARALPLLPRAEWLELLATSTAALDRYAFNPERELAVSFRQMDAVAAGLPLILDPHAPLADLVRAHGAGWPDLPLEQAMQAAIDAARADDGAAAGARALAARFDPDLTERPVVTWTPRRRALSWNLLRAGGALGAAEVAARAERARRAAAEREVEVKRQEIDALNLQVRALCGAVESATAAVADVAGLRREVVQVLGARLSGREVEGEHLRRELEIVRADLEKKTRELEAAHGERDRLGRLYDRLRGTLRGT